MVNPQSPAPLSSQAVVELLRQEKGGVTRWNDYRKAGGLVPELNNVNLSRLNLSHIDFSAMNLANSDLSGSNLAFANLSVACLASVNLKGAELGGSILTGTDFQEAYLSEINGKGVDFRKAKGLAGCDLTKSILVEANFSMSSLVSCRLERANLNKAKLTGSDLTAAVLFECRLREADLVKAVLEKANFEKCDLNNAQIMGASGKAVQFDHADMRDVRAMGCNLVNSFWTAAKLNNSNWKDAVIDGGLMNRVIAKSALFMDASLGDCNLDSAELDEAILIRANLRGCKFNSKTTLEGADVRGCKVDRLSLIGLRDYGGLTDADRSEMNIFDDVALLRSRYSGFWQWFHIAALGVFVAPYLWFLVSEYSYSTFSEDLEGRWMMLGEALIRFIYFGGVDWARPGWGLPHLSLFVFVYALIYNSLRFALLYKTKQLELTEQATGVSTKFSLNPRAIEAGWKDRVWGCLHKLASWGFYFNLLLLLYNCIHFLSRKIFVD